MIERVETSRGPVALRRYGAGDAEPLVCLHGFTGSGETWGPLALSLGTHRPVLAPDLPGHGETRADAFDFPAATALVVEALERVGLDRFSLLGYSMGGRVALAIALDHVAKVTRLVLESASPGLPTSAERSARRVADHALAAGLERDGLEPFVSRWEAQPLFSTLHRLPPAERARLRRQRLAHDPAGLAASLRGLGTGKQPWLGGRLHEVRVPVLLVAGAEDVKFRDWAQWMAARIRRAEIAVVEGAGHVPHLERPEGFSRRLSDFLASPAGAPVKQEETCRSNGRR